MRLIKRIMYLFVLLAVGYYGSFYPDRQKVERFASEQAHQTPRSILTTPKSLQTVPVPDMVEANFEDLLWQFFRHFITQDTTIETRTFNMRSGYIVTNGAKLTIRNCKILGTHPDHNISIDSGSSLEIYNSDLVGDGIKSYFSIDIAPGANFMMKDSKLLYGGD